jgi:hypothetical protein
MKYLFSLIILVITNSGAIAQRIIEKNFSYKSNQQIDFNLQIADSIRIQTWSKNEVSVRASVSIGNNRYNDEYIVTFDESASEISVKAKIESKRNNKWTGDTSCCNADISWTIYVPEKAPVNVETINGNIIITGNTSAIKAHSISGFIDMVIPGDLKADFRLSTITGTVYSDIVKPENAKFKKGGPDFSSQYRGGGTPVDLKTISGDIFIRGESN